MRRSGGFTLLETVVTLVIVSLLVATLMQALSQALGLRTRLLRLQEEARRDFLHEAWFRDTVAAAQADVAEGLGAMEGTRQSLSYPTPVPLVAQGMSRVRWWLEPVAGGVSLHYGDPETQDLVLVHGPLQEASFAYLDHQGAWHDEWSPAADSPERLPRLVRFQAQTAKGQLFWLVPLLSDPIPLELMHPDGLGDGL